MLEYFIKKGYFRNANHAMWFVSSVSSFIFIVLIYLSKFNKFVLFLPIVFHLSPIINSVVKNVIKKEKSEIYSVDCIWFNALMIVLYLILMYKL